MRLTAYRGLTAIQKYGQPGPEGSLTKWMWSDTNQRLTQFAAELLGPRALRAEDPWSYELLRARGNSIEGGTTEVLKNIVAERVLGLPKVALGSRPWTSTSPPSSARSRKRRLASCSPRAPPFAKVREAAETATYDAALWSELVGLGWPGIAVAAEHGGQGLGAVELAVLVEELGYACAATPFLSTATAAAVIQATGSDEQRARWLPGLAAGQLSAGIGTRELAADAAGAAVVLVHDGEEAQLIASPETGDFVSIDPTRRFATPRGRGHPASAPTRPTVSAARRSQQSFVGVCQRALDMTLAYVKEAPAVRGVPVGSFQAVAHRCAEMQLHTESARSSAYYSGVGRRRPTRSCCPRQRRSPPPRRPRAARRSPPGRSRCTAGSGSRGRPTCTGCSSARSWTWRCWAAPSATARRSLGWRPPGSSS